MKILITEFQCDSLISGVLLNEFNEKLVNNLIQRFVQDNPDLEQSVIRAYINRFSQIKDSPNVREKDITRYSWKELEKVVNDNQPNRIKAGRINDGEPKDANLIYNENKLRIYVGKTQEGCIKYGNGYSFCLSSRGPDNMYYHYRFELDSTPYFIFDDTKSSQRDDNGKFIDPTHLLVLLFYNVPQMDNYIFSITTANNDGSTNYENYEQIEFKYPRLKGLVNLFKTEKKDPKEIFKNELENKYTSKLEHLYNEYKKKFNETYSFGDFKKDFYFFDYFGQAVSNVDKMLQGKTVPYKFMGSIKKTAKADDYEFYNAIVDYKITRFRIVDLGKDNSLENEVIHFFRDALMKFHKEPKGRLESIKDWDITYKKLDSGLQNEFFMDVKELVDEYKRELFRGKIK